VRNLRVHICPQPGQELNLEQWGRGRWDRLRTPFYIARTAGSEQKSKSELHLSRVSIETGDLAKIAVRYASIGVVIVCLIENVKKVGLKSKLFPLLYCR
jgi:hypothetical protein